MEYNVENVKSIHVDTQTLKKGNSGRLRIFHVQWDINILVHKVMKANIQIHPTIKNTNDTLVLLIKHSVQG